MFKIELASRKPIYEQICEQTKMLICTDILQVGDKMPSVRMLSVKLAVNPNTIQRAYSDLCLLGILYSIAGKGLFVSKEAKQIILKDTHKEIDEFSTLVEKLMLSGVPKNQLTEKIAQIYDKEKNL